MDIIENPSLMEPLLPPEGQKGLEDLTFDIIKETSSLAANLPEQIIQSIGDLVRSMNCYYSNLIEGHNTHPVDIERALKNDYSKDPKKRVLQREAFAHIEVQKLIDDQDGLRHVCDKEYLCWIHKEFCSRLPSDLLEVRNPDTNKVIKLIPGELRIGEVTVGGHLAPVHSKLHEFLQLFEARYNAPTLSKMQRIVAVAASHHRLLWIHPFLDGNGRVARLFSHAFLKQVGLSSSLWSVSRGLARSSQEYKAMLMGADDWRQGDWDGRGSLSERGLIQFCEFFLKTCLDQVKFMSTLLEPSSLQGRIKRYCEEEEACGELQKGSFPIIREVLLSGEIARGAVESVTGYKDRQARNIVRALLDKGLLNSESTRAPLRLSIPHVVVERWFPKLYPAETLKM
jgi:Fic family protein